MIPLSAIVIGNSNPRKAFDEDAINELAVSIKAKGVIQPILLRFMDKAGVYELVCGERRFRASRIAGLTDIPAYIKELTDDEAFQLQITENLQRKDVHPMDEAYAFKQTLEKHSTEYIIAEFGKSAYFIRQRLKLNDLTPDWQKLFYKNLLPVSDALKVAMLPAISQSDILENLGIDEDNIGHFDKQIKIQSWQFDRAQGKLSDAPFDISNKELDKKAGACIGCPYNSATANLFPEDVQSPKCSNITCFSNKCDINFETEVTAAIEDLTVTLISDSWQVEKKIEEKYKKLGREVLANNQYSDIQEDNQVPDWEEFKDDNEGNYDTEAELKEAFDKEVLEYQDEQKNIQNKIASGKYIKAFYVDGNNKGKYVNIELSKKASSSARSEIVKGDPGIAGIDFEIEKIRDREKRAKELDKEKVHRLIVDALKQDTNLKKLPSEFTDTDRVLMCFLLQEHISYQTRDIIKKTIGITSTYDSPKGDKNFELLAQLTDEQLAFMVRLIALDKYQTHLPATTSGYMVHKLAECQGTIPIETYQQDQQARADKRQKKVNDRIAELQEQKKELQATVKPDKPEPKSKKVSKKKAK